METTYFPPKQKASVWNLLMMAALVLLGLGLVILANLPAFNQWALLIIVIAFLLAVPFFYVLFQYSRARQIRYVLGDQQLRVEWGPNWFVAPLKKIEWAHQLSEFEGEMPLPHRHLPGIYLNLFEIQGMGKTRFVATDPERMILIKAEERYVVISPEGPQLFLESLNEQKSLALATDETVMEENFKGALRSVWKDKWVRTLVFIGVGLVGLLWLTVSLLNIFRPTITWVTMEEVRANQLFLLPIFGTFIFLMSNSIGFVMRAQSRSDERFLYLIVASACISNLVLILASLMMGI